MEGEEGGEEAGAAVLGPAAALHSHAAAGGGGGEEQPPVYCAVGVGREEDWKANLQWVLANVPRSRRLVLAHLRRPPSRINMMGAWVPVSQLADEEVTAFRQLEEDKIGQVLDDLLDICKSQKVNASKIIVASDDTARGLVQLVDDHGVTELIMGAASDRAYTRKMRAPRSKKALTVQRKANPSCKICFVCKGNLICTREASEGAHRAESSTTSTSPRSSTSDYSRSKSSPRLHSETFSTQESNDPATTRRADATLEGLLDNHHHATAPTTTSVSEIVEADTDEQLVLHQVQEDQGVPSPDGSDAGEMDDTLYEKLKDALVEAENLRREAYQETRRRQMAERELAEASKMADDAESSYRREAEQRKQMEATLGRERAAMEEDRRELHDILDKIRKADERSAELELQIANSERVMSDLEARLSESYDLLGTLRPRRAATTAREEEIDGERYQLQVGAASSSSMRMLRRLGYSELDEATNHFDESARVDGGRGDGGRGKVYRAELRGMAVAVKVLRRDVAVDEARFTREVERISGLKHPNLAAVVGACPEARAVAYELVPGGSLEEHLDLAAAGRRSLPWRARCGIAYGACSALAFLHSATSSAPPRVDVTPASILVVGSSSCKLAGLGTRGLVVVDHGHDHHPVSRPALAYADPTSCYLDEEEEEEEQQQQQQQQRDADVYSLGVVLLRLATGMPAFLARKAAREAAGGGRAWREVVDACWPAERGREVALLGLRCCATPRRELLEEARGVLEAALVSSAPAPAPSRSSAAVSAAEPDDDGAPSYLVCPILKEVMRDPRIAGDGFTYEAEAIEEWLRGGRDTSPMTNLKLPTTELVPNHALRHAIHRWRTEETRRFFS